MPQLGFDVSLNCHQSTLAQLLQLAKALFFRTHIGGIIRRLRLGNSQLIYRSDSKLLRVLKFHGYFFPTMNRPAPLTACDVFFASASTAWRFVFMRICE